MSASNGYLSYRPLTPEEFESVCELHRRAGTQAATVKGLMWQYQSETLPIKGIIVGAFLSNRLVGTQALIPMLGIHDGETILTAKSEHTLLDPVCRGMGVFAAMYEVAFDWATQSGIKCIWGFTSAVKSFRSTGFEIGAELFDESVVFRPVRYLANRLVSFGFHDADEVALPTEIPSAVEGKFKILRNAAYLSYRYDQNPFRKVVFWDEYRGVLFSCAKTDSRYIFISEVVEHSTLLESMREYTRRKGVGLVFRRVTTHPHFSAGEVLPWLYKKTPSGNFIVFRWLEGSSGIPSFVVDEGCCQGVA